MIYEIERRSVVEYGRRLCTAGLTTGTGGNLSLMLPTREAFLVTPSGIEYDAMQVEDIVVVDLYGKVAEGQRTPSSELQLHLLLYRERADISAIVHTHSPYATTLACLNEALPPVHYLVGFAGRSVPCAAYATYGTEQLGKNAVVAMGAGNAVLLANHGLVAVGNSLTAAFTVAEEIEFVARLYLQAKAAGRPVLLSDDEMDRVIEKFKHYGPQEEK